MSKKVDDIKMKSSGVILLSLVTISFFSHANARPPVSANGHTSGKGYCRNPYYWRCFGLRHACPPGCPHKCEVDCRSCKPYCACDKPGAVCQDPRFIGGDGVMFYFHGKKDTDFCLVSDSDLHINGHFIGKKSQKGRDFTWVQSIGVLFGGHKLYLGAKKVSQWHDLDDNLGIQLDGADIKIPSGEGEMWTSPEGEFMIYRTEEENEVVAEAANLFRIRARVVPITDEESRVHGYDVGEDDCFAHLELAFKFGTLSASVDGVLGQTYVPDYSTRVKIGAAMPIMGGADKYTSSHLFAADCTVSKFGQERDGDEMADLPAVACGADQGGDGQGIVCRK